MEETQKKPKINKKELWRTLKFVLFSISAGVIQLVSSLLLKLLILDHFIPEDASFHYMVDLNTTTFIADTIGLALSVLWNFTFNRKFTFKAANNVPVAMLLAFLFYVPFYHFQIWYIDTIEKCLVNIGDWGFVIALGTCMIINFILEYLWQTFVVFRGAIDTNDVAKKEQAKTAEQNQTNEQTVQSVIATDDVSQKVEVDVILTNAGSNLIDVIKVIRTELIIDLPTAKKIVENTPAIIAEHKLKDEAVKIADELRKVGATVELK
ncbi:MAG: ribosomal protein L7/L12 [Clostridia bacterium]|nr:ribosomal protein L7/L12 [Clostridia bacterium]